MSSHPLSTASALRVEPEAGLELSLLEIAYLLAAKWRWLLLAPLATGLAALAASFAVDPLFTARVSFLPPQQQQSAAVAALSQLGNLAGLAGATGGAKSTAEQYVALVQSTTVQDRLIERFKLLEVYGEEFKVDARKKLAAASRAGVGKKDGLIVIEVDDHDPKRAADMATAFVDELRRKLSTLAVTEAQQRRLFFEERLAEARDGLSAAQVALQRSGFGQGALQSEPRAAAESFARLRAEVTAAEVRLLTLRQSRADGSAEIQQSQASLQALKSQLARLEADNVRGDGPDYVGKFREFKYRETLFELFARQYELARVDEAREGSLIQIVDAATPPERKSWPKRGLFAVAVTIATAVLLSIWFVGAELWRRALRARAERYPSESQT